MLSSHNPPNPVGGDKQKTAGPMGYLKEKRLFLSHAPQRCQFKRRTMFLRHMARTLVQALDM